jgi:putative oxidoreductase
MKRLLELARPAPRPWRVESDATARDHHLFVLLRCVLAGLIAAHGWARWAAQGVDPFGQWLTQQGVPAGWALAWAVTALEIAGTPLLALGFGTVPLALAFAAVYATGVALLHAKVGWFVVGLGRNGAEYSVLLITALLLVAAHHRAAPRAEGRRPPDGT